MTDGSIVKDMAITHRDFARLIRKLDARVQALAGDGTRLQLPWGTGRVLIELGPETEQRLGAIALTRVRVDLRADALAAEEWAHFLRRFDCCFQRGGG